MTGITPDQHDVAVAGDAMVTKRLSTIERDRFAGLRSVVTDADASIVNLEGPIHDYDVAPSQRRRTHFRSPAWALDELEWMGFDLFSAATNHVGDYGQGGMSNTMAELRDRTLPFAGIGRTLTRARSPAYYDAGPGRVALLGATTTFVPGTEAADPREDVPGRVGVAPIRMNARYELSRSNYRAMKAIAEDLGMGELRETRGAYVRRTGDDAIPFIDVGSGTAGRTVTFTEGPENRIVYSMSDEDRAAALDHVRTAVGKADTVVFSLHTHEGAGGAYNAPSVPKAVETFARECVDAGADLFFCHGPHHVRGIEVYDGAPIFYGLGNVVLQYNDVSHFPAEDYQSRGLAMDAPPREIHDEIGNIVSTDRWNEGIVPVCTATEDGVTDAQIHPVELGGDRSHSTNGTGFLAPEGAGESTFERVADRSAVYGTSIDIADGVGSLRGL
ncbi:MAG: CapA family protein [Halanaeroarchaeum sp.]